MLQSARVYFSLILIKMQSHSAEKLTGQTMLKTLFFAIFVMLVTPVPAASLMSHEKFVHLSYEEQKKVVIATMELVVEIEQKYKHETRRAGFNLERYQRYTDFMRKVSNLLFPEAHAARNERYGQYLNQLRNILGQTDKCLYGGWISTMGANNKCVHPRFSNGFSQYYQSETGCSDGGRNNITCNPAIFGFKNVTRKTLFCVPAGESGADNTSRDCMRKALAEPAEEGASSRDDRIRNMIDGIAVNPNDANAVFDFLLKACACQAKPREISQHYHNYMRPHRTCLSILRMMAEVMPQCSANPGLMDANQLSFLNNLKTSTQSILSQENIEANYEPMVREFMNRSDYQAVCGPSDNSGGQNPPGGGAVTVDRDPDTQVNPPDGTPGGDQGGTPGGTSGTPNDGNGTPDRNPESGVEPAERPFCEPRPATPPAPEAPAAPATAAAPEAPAAPATAAAPETPAAPEAPATGEAAVRAGNPPEQTPPPAPATGPNPPNCICRDGSEPSADGSCPEQPAAEETPASNVSFSLSIKTETNVNVTIEAGVNPSDKKEEYTIIWFRSTAVTGTVTSVSGSRTSPNPEPEVSLTPEGDQPEPARPEPIDRTAPDGKTDLGDTLDGAWSVTANRMNQDYQVCARFIKVSDNSAADNKCVTVKKQVAQPGGMRPFGGPQMPGRGGASDAVFRGIR